MQFISETPCLCQSPIARSTYLRPTALVRASVGLAADLVSGIRREERPQLGLDPTQLIVINVYGIVIWCEVTSDARNRSDVDHSEATELTRIRNQRFHWIQFSERVSLSSNEPAGSRLGTGANHCDTKRRCIYPPVGA